MGHMQRDPNFCGSFEMDGYSPGAAMEDYYSYCVPPSSNATPAGGRNGYPGPFNGVELQPSNTCPKNFLIFDQTENKSRVMFHPAFAQKHDCQNLDVSAIHSQYYSGHHMRYADNQDWSSSSLKEDSDDIDALLSLEEEEEDNEEDDVVSTGRTPSHYRSTSPDSVSFSADGSKAHKVRSSSQSSSSNAVGARKREKMKKMVKALKGIVPGGDQMDTPAVLDEAVRYLKSLKVEVQKLGIQNFKN